MIDIELLEDLLNYLRIWQGVEKIIEIGIHDCANEPFIYWADADGDYRFNFLDEILEMRDKDFALTMK